MQQLERRGFFRNALAALGLGAAAGTPYRLSGGRRIRYRLPAELLPGPDYRSLKQSSCDPSGGNHDFWLIKPGETRAIFDQAGPGAITHIWFTIAASTNYHLKELVLRAYWDGNPKPSVETRSGISSV